MIETRETHKPNVFHVKANSFTFEHNGEEVELPMLRLRGYKPSYKDNLVIYKEEDANGNNSTMNYSFEGKNGELKALYSVHQSGSVDVKLAGREVTHISAEDMGKIKNNEAGFFFKSAEGTDFVENNTFYRLGLNAFLTGGTGGCFPIGCGAQLVMTGFEGVDNFKNKNPKEVKMDTTTITHEGTPPPSRLTRAQEFAKRMARRGWNRRA